MPELKAQVLSSLIIIFILLIRQSYQKTTLDQQILNRKRKTFPLAYQLHNVFVLSNPWELEEQNRIRF